MTTQPNPTSESGFIPRKEFIKDQRAINHFCLLAISGSNFIRLYSFPAELINALRRLFDHFNLTVTFREQTTQNFSEFTLDGKPWASPKSAKTERLLVDIIAVIYRHGYSFLSTIDYGRENDDRLAITFAKPSPTPFALNVSASALPIASGSNISHPSQKGDRTVPFGISFISATLMRVICPPLHSTPAILQAVRGSWPRGIVSEKKVGDASYEFKLKGYKWFQEDTFATDSLQHILSLLSTLDIHAFTLIASFSLTHRSRVKDLWIFTGLAPDDGPDSLDSPIATNSFNGSNPELRRSSPTPNADPVIYSTDKNAYGVSQHRRMATVPVAVPGSLHLQQQYPQPYPYATPPSVPYGRAPPERIPASAFGAPPRLSIDPAPAFRKPAPRAQVPISVNLDVAEEQEQDRVTLASKVPSDIENMTGIGTASRSKFVSGVINAVNPSAAAMAASMANEVVPAATLNDPEKRQERNGDAGTPSLDGDTPATRSRSTTPSSRVGALRPVSTRSKTPPLLTSRSSPSPNWVDSPPPMLAEDQPAEPTYSISDAQLLSYGAFGARDVRDSAFSSNTDASGISEIPIKWTGLSQTEGLSDIAEMQEEQSPMKLHPSPKMERQSTTPHLPGAWKATPTEERTEPLEEYSHAATEKPSFAERRRNTSLRDVDARITSPELVTNHDEAIRKSEAGLIGMMPPSSQVPQMASRASPSPLNINSARAANGLNSPPSSPTRAGREESSREGWVLVNVEGKPGPPERGRTLSQPLSPHYKSTSPTANGRGVKNHVASGGNISSMSPAAKTIAIIDAKEARSKKEKSKTSSSSSGLRRILSLTRAEKTKEDVKSDGRFAGTQSSDALLPGEKRDRGKQPTAGLREKLKRFGGSEPAARPAVGKRLSID